MTTQPLPVTEVARRLCEAHHPHLATTGAVIPCGPHTTIARTHYGLLTPEGDKTWAVLAAIRAGEPKADGLEVGMEQGPDGTYYSLPNPRREEA